MRTDTNTDSDVSNTIDNKAKLETSKALLYHLIFELIPGTISLFINVLHANYHHHRKTRC